MSFSNFLNQAWNDHAQEVEQVADRLEAGMNLIERNEDIIPMANLIAHVMGEHLGLWDKGVHLLERLSQNRFHDSGGETTKALARSIASLELASGKRQAIDDFSQSDQIRILVIASSALSEQKDTDKAVQLFQAARGKAETGIDKGDPANRALAVTGNNLACSLEEKSSRSTKETEFMILAAQTALQLLTRV